MKEEDEGSYLRLSAYMHKQKFKGVYLDCTYETIYEES